MKNVEDVYAASPLQQGLIFHGLYAPESSAYTVQMVCDLEGRLDAGAFREAWRRVFARYSVLRTFFMWEGKRVLQVVRLEVELPWREWDWRAMSAAEQGEELETLVRRDRAQGFEFSKAPLVRIALVRLGEGRAKFVWSHHHSLLDGWSAFRVFGDAFKLYEGLIGGREVRLSATRPYRDYIGWLQRQDLAAAERFWRERLRGFTHPSPLTGVRHAEPEPLSEADEQEEYRERLPLSPEMAAALKLMARRHQLTLNTIMQGAWALLLSRYSGEPDVVFGAVVSGRPPELEGVEEMVGLFINLLPVRVQVEEGAELVGWLKGLQAGQVEARCYEYSPLVDVQGWSDVPRGQPLFETMMVFENYPIASSTKKNEVCLRMTRVKNVEKTNYPLTFEVVPAGALVLQLSYDANYFKTEQVVRMLAHLGRIVEEMVARPGGRLRELSLLTAAERRQLLVEWNDTRADYPRDACLHQLFEEQAACTPDRIAVVYADESITYAELNARANRLANYLRLLGVGPDVLVGIMVERSPQLLVGLLGILKAGGAYIPLDPAYPRERLALMLEDAQAPVLLTEQRLAESVPQHLGQVVLLDADWSRIAQEDAVNLSTTATATNLSYVIYTSGSTGRPKGVQITHRAVVNFLHSMQRRPGITKDDVLAAVTSLSFDIAALELFLPLMAGATVALISRQEAGDGERLMKRLNDCGATLMQATPSTWRLLLEAGWQPGERLEMLCGGEELPRDLAAALLTQGASLWNMYGPTETTIWSAVHKVESANRSIPIGRPIANTEICILDPELEPSPVGIAGHLYLGGDGLARGYLGRAALTAESFIPHPFATRPGARLYRTGDLARYLPGGDVEFLGRSDHQLKIRGFRIEAGEVEAALAAHPAVREVVVQARPKGSGDKQLVAYLVAAVQPPPTPGELRRHLRPKLPDYMIPTAFVTLDALPLTANGKVDRRRLPAPEALRPEAEAGYVAPRTAAERTLADIWQEVLGVARVGVHDNFFDLGGDSILSIQIVARANRAGLRLSPRLMFEHQEVAALAGVGGGGVAGAEQVEVGGAVSLTPVQRWFFAGERAHPAHFNQAVMLSVRAGTEVAQLEAAVRHLVEYHDALRLRFTAAEAGWEAHYGELAGPVFARVDLRALADAATRAAAIEAEAEAAQASLDLGTGPLVRALYFDCGAHAEGRLLIVIHHLVVDGVSWRILLDDLERGYEQLSRDEPIELGAKTTSFQRWAAELVTQAQGEGLRREAAYWSEQPWEQALPMNSAGDNQSAGRERTVRLSLSAAETRALLQEVPEAYHTQINEVLLTALGRALGGWVGEGQVVIDLEGHGREEIAEGLDLSRTVGWFTAIFPVLLEVGEGEGVGEGLKRVKEQVRAIPQHGIGYGMLKYLSEDEEVRARMRAIPAAEVSFNYLGQFDRVLSGGGVLGGARESVGAVQGAGDGPAYRLRINGVVREGRFEVSWGFDGGTAEEGAVTGLAERYMGSLREIIEHCGRAGAGGFTLSDFPLTGLNEEKLGKLSSLLDRLADK